MRSVNGSQQAGGARLTVPDWLNDVVPAWLAEVVRPKKVPMPWATMGRAVLALWVPMAIAFATGRRDLAMLPAMGALLSIMIDNGGPFWGRVVRISVAGVFGGGLGLVIGTVIHGTGWPAVASIVVVAGVSALLARLGGIGSVTGLQLFVYSALGLGPLGLLRPVWHTVVLFLAGVVWSLVLITPGYLISPRSHERKAVAEVYRALAGSLRVIGTPGTAAARVALATALNDAYDAMLTWRAHSSGRSGRDMQLMAVLNASHPFSEAVAALRATGERVPPLVTAEIDKFAEAILHERGPGSGMVGLGSRRARRAGGTPPLPLIPPPWSPSPGALALREAMVVLVRVLSGNWTPSAAPRASSERPGPRTRLRRWSERFVEQLIGGRIAWEFTVRLMLCTGVAAVISEVLPLARSYWVVLTVGIILKPDYGSVFARAVQRGAGTVVGAVLGAVILITVPYGPWLLLPFGVLAALLPYGKARNFGLAATFLTPFVVLLIDLLAVAGWRLALDRLVDTAIACAVVLIVGYAPWPSAWQAHLPTQFAEALRAVCAYADQVLITTPAERIANTGTARAPGRMPGEEPPWRSRLRRRTYRALSNLRAEFQRMMSEPTPVSRRASAWWPAVVALEELMDAVTACMVAIGRGEPVPNPASVHQLTGALRSVADAIETEMPPRVPGTLPSDPELDAVTSGVRSVLSVLIKTADGPGGGGQGRPVPGGAPAPAPAPA
ncbi:FUSC family protein [Trebonia kvetii]|uniref:FUSC family protein n=1 Tax=Trebonia kvetii TaxID=2480626 RepID=A0A6P2BV91_9ACTN|nr:FUSC family protein [Trebonia kvetii]TVZ02810.1 FUSC family protein [Trebonia kvetii]